MHKKPDYEALFRTSPYPYLVMSADLTIIGANDAYLRSTGRAEADIVGKYVFDAFPSNPDDPDSTNIHEVKSSLERAIARGVPDTMAFLRYAVPRQTPEGVVFDERYWSTVHTPVRNAAGEIDCVIQNAIDVTDLYSFNKKSKHILVEQKLKVARGADDFNRAQMHEALTRILNDERGHLRNLFNQSPGFVAVLTGPDHVFEMVNEAYYQLVGHRDILNKPVWEALPEVVGQGFEELLDGVISTGKPWVGHGMRIAVQREANGPISERYVDLLYHPLCTADGAVTGIFVQGHDVTEAYEAMSAKRDSEERLQEGMLAAKMVVWDWDIRTRKLIFSDNAALIFGRDVQTIDEISSYIDHQDILRLNGAREKAITEKSGYQEIVRFTRADNGREIWLDIRGKVICDAGGTARSLRGVSLDVTERILAEQELRDADRRKDEFLAMLAHELRNPLAPISAAAKLMKIVKLDEARLRQTSDVILRQITHMTGLVDDLIDVSRVTRGLISTEKKPLDLKRIVADAVEQNGPVISARHHRLAVHLSPGSAHIEGDQKRLVQVLTNLLNNAAKYTPDGGNIIVNMEAGPDCMTLSVTDDGIGITPELLPRVFDLFTQGERTSDRAQGGLGVGLALVKSLVELHAGSVMAASAGVGKGSTFTIRLPRLSTPDEAHGAGDDAAPAPVAAPQLRVMIVDDNADAADMLAMFLEASGYQIEVQYGARSALERAALVAPDVFLLDIGLPEINGNEMARYLRSHPASAKAMLIAITGYGQEQDRQDALAAGFDHHFVKPVDTDQLADLLSGIRRPG